MAITTVLSNRYKYQVLVGAINFQTHAFKIALMSSGFTFDPDAHGTFADIATGELANGMGYATGGKLLTGVALNQDNAGDRATVSWTNPEWTAAGGDLGPTHSAIVYDYTIAEKTVIGCVNFGQDALVSDGNKIRLENLALRLA